MKNGRDKTVVDLDPDEFAPKEKKRMNIVSSFPLPNHRAAGMSCRRVENEKEASLC